MSNHTQIINAAWLYSQVNKKRICAELKKSKLTDFGRTNYLLLLGYYTEMGDLAEPYKNFIFPLEMLIEGAADDHELETLPKCKAFLREYRSKLKDFYQAGGTEVMPTHLVDFLKEIQSNPPQLQGNERGIKIVNYLLECSDEQPDIFYGDRDDYKSISSTFQKAAESRIENTLALFNQLDSLAEIDLTQPVPQIRKSIQDQMNRFSDLLC